MFENRQSRADSHNGSIMAPLILIFLTSRPHSLVFFFIPLLTVPGVYIVRRPLRFRSHKNGYFPGILCKVGVL